MAAELWVDFNDAEADGTIDTLVKLATVDLFPGRSVVVGDSEGNTCTATVVEITDTLVTLTLDLGTLRMVEQFEQATA